MDGVADYCSMMMRRRSGVVRDGLVAYDPLSTRRSQTLYGGMRYNFFSGYGSVSYETHAGVKCMRMDVGAGKTDRIYIGGTYAGDSSFTESVWFAMRSTSYIFFGAYNSGNGICIHRQTDGASFMAYIISDCVEMPFTDDAWYHFAITYDAGGRSAKVYCNGSVILQKSTDIQQFSNIVVNGAGMQDQNFSRTRAAGFRLYNRALSAPEIGVLAQEFAYAQ